MTAVLVIVAVLVVLALGLVLGALLRGLVFAREDRRRLERLATRLAAEQRIDALTRSTLAAMRDSVGRRS